MTVDRGREAVYAAEVAAFEGTAHESIVAFGVLVRTATTITGAAWWPHGDVTVVAARRDAETSTTRQRRGDAPVVRLAAPQMTTATLLHELAHVLAGVAAGHGPLFRRAHLDLVDVALGHEPASWLLDAYAAMQLAPGDRTWPAPPSPGGGPIAL